MDIIIIILVSMFASLLTLFSGFGLGTILTPFFALFFPVNLAVALTGVVHLLNNIFKVFLFKKDARWDIVLKFGIPSIIGAFAGAWLLIQLSDLNPLYEYILWEKQFSITPIKLTIALLIIVFTFLEFLPLLKNLSISGKYLIPGGLTSGFFGGLSGNQGALRSAFLVKLNFTKNQFIATGVMIAILVDVTRLSVYFADFTSSGLTQNLPTLVASALSAFAGAYIGSKLLNKVTYKNIQRFVTAMLLTLAVLLGAGIL